MNTGTRQQIETALRDFFGGDLRTASIALQGLHSSRLVIPRKLELQPDPELLSRRWERFRKAA